MSSKDLLRGTGDSNGFLEKSKSILRSNTNKTFVLLILFMGMIGCGRVISTYRVFWQTWDEPFHIGAGLEWLDKGRFTYEPYHPPLARVMMAIGPYLNGVRIVEMSANEYPPLVYVGNSVLQSGNYEKNLATARLGILPFFIVAILVVAFWTRSIAGPVAALLAVLLFTTLPVVLAHAGFATLDMAAAAMVAASLFAFVVWLRDPSPMHSIILGVVGGLTILSKLSTSGFVIADGILMLFLYAIYLLRTKSTLTKSQLPGWKIWFVRILMIFLFFGITIWAGYRFSVGHFLNAADRPHGKIDAIVGPGMMRDALYAMAENAPLPAPEFVQGVKDFFSRNDQGHLAYFLGDIRESGWWYYFPVILLLKTPIAFIILSLFGFFFIFQNIFQAKQEFLSLSFPAVAAVGVLVIGMTGKIDNGVRQILSIYPLLTIVAAYGAAVLLSYRGPFRRLSIGLVMLLLFWQVAASAFAHPDYLSYFNELAGNHPERIAVDSDLDWGQDLKRLSNRLHDRGVDQIAIAYNGSVGIDLTKFGLPPFQQLEPYQHESGWVAISIFDLTLGTGQAPYDQFDWLKQYQPVERVGKSIWLYYIPSS